MRIPIVALIATGLVVACGGGNESAKPDSAKNAAAPQTGGADLTGAGATFPFPLYNKWSSEYRAKYGVTINYQSIGSGGGIRQLSEQTVDFGASDAPMSDTELAAAKGGPVLHIPTVLGAVVLTYNLPGVTQPLKLTGEVIADIYLGKITKWNDARLATLNAGVKLPATNMLVVHRSEGSGTTFIFTDYLTAISPGWAKGPGKGKDVQWPVGLGARGNEGVSGQVKQTPGSIGVTELTYANQNKLPAALVKNADGQFVAPSVDGMTGAAASANLPPNTDYRVSIVNAPGATSYPISSFTWLLVYRNQPNADKGKKLVDFLKWALHDGEQYAATLDYGPLPANLTARIDATIASIKVGATP